MRTDRCAVPPCLLFFVPLFLSVFFSSGCSGDRTDQQLDYASIPLTDLRKTLTIAESEHYLPGWINRVMVSDEGHILVSQRSEKSIHQFDSLGNHLARVAGPGRGPGELSRNANAHFNGRILVMSNNNGMLTEYRAGTDGIFAYHQDHHHRLPGPLHGIRSPDDFSAFYVRIDSARTPFGKLPPEFTTDFVHLVRVTADTLQVREQILSLRKHSSYVQVTDGGRSMTYSFLPYRYSDYFMPLPGRKILVQRPGQAAIQIYDRELNLEHQLTLQVKPRPVTESDMDFHFPELSRRERNDRRALIRDIKPPFMRVILDGQNRFWLHTDETEKGSEYVILDYEGKPLGRVLLPPKRRLHAIRHGKLYVTRQTGQPAVEVYAPEL